MAGLFLKLFLLLCIAVVLARCKPRQRSVESWQPRSSVERVIAAAPAAVHQRSSERNTDDDDGEEDDDDDGDDEEDDEYYQDGDDYEAGGTTTTRKTSTTLRTRAPPHYNDDEISTTTRRRLKDRKGGKDRGSTKRMDCIADRVNYCVEWCRFSPAEARQRRNRDGEDCRYWRANDRNKWMQSGKCRNGRCT